MKEVTEDQVCQAVRAFIAAGKGGADMMGAIRRAVEEAYAAAPAAPVAAPAPSDQDKLDAERYRWIRDSGPLPQVLISGRWYGTQHSRCLDLDVAVDTARADPYAGIAADFASPAMLTEQEPPCANT